MNQVTFAASAATWEAPRTPGFGDNQVISSQTAVGGAESASSRQVNVPRVLQPVKQ